MSLGHPRVAARRDTTCRPAENHPLPHVGRPHATHRTTPPHSTPRYATHRATTYTAPPRTAPRRNTTRRAATRHAPHHAAARHATPCHTPRTVPCHHTPHTTPPHAMPCHATPRHVEWPRIAHCAMPRRDTSSGRMPRATTRGRRTAPQHNAQWRHRTWHGRHYSDSALQHDVRQERGQVVAVVAVPVQFELEFKLILM